MLVLSRKRHENLIIGGCIEVAVLEIRSGRVKLGISAPEHVSVQRGEIETHRPPGGAADSFRKRPRSTIEAPEDGVAGVAEPRVRTMSAVYDTATV